MGWDLLHQWRLETTALAGVISRPFFAQFLSNREVEMRGISFTGKIIPSIRTLF
jgi:hypothetical protein